MSTAHGALQAVLAGGDLDRPTTEALFGQLMDGELTEVMKSALLVALLMKGEAVSEIAGAAAAMRGRVRRIPHGEANVIDTCGTGGDGKGTFNVSTAAAVVAASAGATVAKHGNRSVSSRSGSADVLAALGVRIDLEPEEAGRALAEVGIAFLFAPKLHPAMKEVMPVRKELGVRTIFNVLGPLTNPAGAKRQLMGVYSAHLVEPLAHVLKELGAEHAMVVHGADGLDEITVTGPTHVAEVKNGEVRSFTVEPSDLGVESAPESALLGGEPEENAEMFDALIDGEAGPRLEITVLNAGAALYVSGVAPGLAEGVRRAREAIASGDARSTLDALRRFGR
ncbi:MAG: anthranilate phosphoribosyltransferase [Acidobacteriota bacterium]